MKLKYWKNKANQRCGGRSAEWIKYMFDCNNNENYSDFLNHHIYSQTVIYSCDQVVFFMAFFHMVDNEKH